MEIRPKYFYKHKRKGSIYYVIDIGYTEKDQEQVVLYQDINTMKILVRPLEEFEDSRFEFNEDENTHEIKRFKARLFS